MSTGLNAGPTPSTELHPVPPADTGVIEKPKPTRILPTDRISFGKQMDTVRAFGSATASGTAKYVTAKQVADIVKMAAQTVSLANPFWVDIKFLSRAEGQGFIVAPELTEYAHAYQWNRDTAAHKLAPVLAREWFWQVLEPQLRFQEITIKAAIEMLSEKVAATPEYRPRLAMILDYLAAAGMVDKANGMISLVRDSRPTVPSQPSASESVEPDPSPARQVRSSVETKYDQGGQGIAFDISVRVDMTEIAGWEPARISAFFSGIAQVIAAKGAMERDLSKE